MSFDRGKAIAYAQAYWTAPCRDGIIGVEDGRPTVDYYRHKFHAPKSDWEAIFVRKDEWIERAIFRKKGEQDIVFHPWDGLDDCAHYVSQCLIAGGANIETQFGAREIREVLKEAPSGHFKNTKTLLEKGSVQAGQRIIDASLMANGDAIIYWEIAPKKGYPKYGHSAMYVGSGGITCHSVCRYKGLGDSSDDEWHLSSGSDYKYTFIHFSDDDTLAAPIVKLMAGWWKVEYAGRTTYYAIRATGKVYKSQRAPSKSTDQAPDIPYAYWFQDHSSITFIWPELGDLEEWIIKGDGSVARAKLNDVSGKVTKLF